MLKVLKSKSLILAILSSSNIAIAFVFQIITFNIIGPGKETDALFLGLSIPTFILSIMVTSLNNVLVPFFSGISKKEIGVYTTILLTIFVGGSIVFSMALWISIGFWLPIIANGFDHETYFLCENLTKIQIIAIPFYMLFSVQWSILNGQKKHIESELPAAIINFLTVPVLLYLLPLYGVYTLAFLYSIKMVLQNIFVFFYLKKIPLHKFSFEQISEIWMRLKPVMLGAIYYKSEPIIDRSLLTNSTSGSLSLFFLAQQIISAFNQVITKSLVTPNIALLSHAHKSKDMLSFKSVYGKTLTKILIILCIVSILFFILGEYASELLLSFRKDSNSINAPHILYTVLFFLFGSLIGNVLGSFVTSSYYAINNTKTPSYISMINYTVYVPLKIVAFYFYDVNGLACVVSLYSLLNVTILYFIFKFKYIKKFGYE